MKFHSSRSWQAHIGYPWLILIIILTVSADIEAETIHHELHVKLQPAQGRISVIDYVQFPMNTDSTVFSLRSSLSVKAPGVELESLGNTADSRMRHYRINRLPPDGKVQLSYEGKITSEGTKGTFDMPESVLGSDGVYLDGGSAWVPRFDRYLWYTFRLQVEAPAGWEIISQGRQQQRDKSFIYEMTHPQDSIYLIGGSYKRYSQMHDEIEIVVYLYEADAELATSYLQASAEYISLYSDWIGPYPYAKFAIVENRWQTGYGMPSFTLLGSRVIRLPFILYTSLPHEILHNWWGNGIYVDFSKGNWSEGLTAYMADHFNDEQQGKDREYRRKALERYANFAAEGRDLALADFSSRHDEASQAVGYSKSMMLFHMLRKLSGDDLFKENIRAFWRRYQFKPVGFQEVIQQFYPGNDDYKAFVDQWLERPGAPDISLGEVAVSTLADGYRLTLEVDQQQAGPGYKLHVPLEVTLEGHEQPQREQITLSDTHNSIELKFKQRPQAVMLDPDYDIFRLLHPGERPASLGRLFGAKKQLLVLPESVSAEQARAWQQLAATWSGRYKNVELVKDSALKKLPDNAAIWLLGWQNSLLKENQQRLSSESQRISGHTVAVDNQEFDSDQHVVVLLDSNNSRTPLGFIGADDPEDIALMARKLPHYSSYGVLAFNRAEAKNIIKQHLPVQVSPMARQLTE
jgi:hypothetical protein